MALSAKILRMKQVNEAQREYWNGGGGERWVAEAERYDMLNQRFGRRLVEVLAAQPGERVLDIGCGNGALALEVAKHVGLDGAVVGLDISEPMLGVARERAHAAGAGNVTFEQGDAQVHSLPPASFHAVTSRFGVMFFEDPVAAFANLASATRPAGRLVFACWQDLVQNEWIMVPAAAAIAHVPFPDMGEPGAPGPFALADRDRLEAVLSDAGWTGITIDAAEEPMRLGTSVEDAMSFLRTSDIAQRLLADADETAAAAALDAIEKAIEPHAGPDGVELTGRAWIVQASKR